MQELLLRQGGLLLLLFAAHQWSSLHMELPHLCRCPSIVQWAPGAPAFHSHHTESPSPPLLCPVYLIFRFALSAAVLSLLSWHPDESWWYFSSNAFQPVLLPRSCPFPLGTVSCGCSSEWKPGSSRTRFPTIFQGNPDVQ